MSHKPGEAQFDFGEAKVIYRGREMKAAFFVMSLPYSDAFFCQAFPRECTETFQEGHRRAFEFFRGVPYRIGYDNTKIAVAKIAGRRGDTPTRELLRLESHYLFGHHFCLVRRPNEKGHTENLVGFARRNFMVPIPRFDDFEQFNEALAEACLKDLQRKLRGTAGTKQKLLEEDRSAMLPLPPAPFEARRIETRTATSLSLVRFDRNDYSIPFALMRQRLEGSLGQEGRREFIKILRLLEKHPIGRLTTALERALQIHATTADAVAILIQDGREIPAKYFSLDGRPHLQGHDVPVPKLDIYDKLRASEGGRS